MLAAKTGRRAGGILGWMLRSLERQGTRHDATEVAGAPVESVGQAAAGGLLIAVAVVELALGFWAAGWQQRAVALSVGCVGAAFMLSGLAQIALARRAAVSRVLRVGLRSESEGR